MKKIFNLKLIAIAYGLFIIFFVSCRKEDVSSNKDMYIYTSSGNSAFNTSNGELIMTIDSINSSEGLSFGLTITRPSESDVKVKGQIDSSLMKEYDLIKNVTSTRYDLSKFSLEKSEIIIPAGELHSKQKFKIVLKDRNLQITTPCVIPVRISTVGNVLTSASRDVMYVVINSQRKVISSFSTILDKINSSYSPASDVFPKYEFPINLNLPIDRDIKVTILNDNVLVDQYNSKNKTNYLKIPDGSMVLLNNFVTIKQKTLVSADSVKIQFPDRSKFQLGKEYLIPIKISNSENAFVSETNDVKYILFNPTVNNIDPTNTPITGTQINRIGWTVTASGRYTNFVIENILDGNNSTAWDAPRPAWFILDMKSIKTVKGFSFVPNYQKKNENILEMDILSSDDGVSWNAVGKYVGTSTSTSSTPANPDIKNVKFYSPVSTRYFRFNITHSSSSGYTGLNELYAIN